MGAEPKGFRIGHVHRLAYFSRLRLLPNMRLSKGVGNHRVVGENTARDEHADDRDFWKTGGQG